MTNPIDDAPEPSNPVPGSSELEVEEPFLEERPIVLSPEAQRQFFEALMSPPNPNEALKKLMRGAAAKPAKKPSRPKKK
jgi:hypothetical protein